MKKVRHALKSVMSFTTKCLCSSTCLGIIHPLTSWLLFTLCYLYLNAVSNTNVSNQETTLSVMVYFLVERTGSLIPTMIMNY